MRKLVFAGIWLIIFAGKSFTQVVGSMDTTKLVVPISVQDNPSEDTAKHKKKATGYVSVNAGLGVPLNGCSTINVTYPNHPELGSFGAYGGNLNIMFCVPIGHTHFGITGLFSRNSQSFDINQYTQKMNRYIDSYTFSLDSSSFTNYKETFLMAGLFFTIPGNVTWDFRVFAGDNLCTLPEFSVKETVTVFSDNKAHSHYVSSTLQSVNSSTIAYGLGISMRVFLFQHIFAMLNIDYIYSMANFMSYLDNYNLYIGNTTGLNQCKFNVTYNLLSFTGGIGYKF